MTRRRLEDSTSYEISEQSILVEHIPTDVQLEIISFLEVPEAIALMASNRMFRFLLTSDAGKSIWMSHINRLFGLKHSQFPMPQTLCLKDDFKIPYAEDTTSDAALYNSYNGVNLPFLLSRIPENLPSTMVVKIPRRDDNGAIYPVDHSLETMEYVCAMRGNNPLPRPVLILPKQDTVLAKARILFSRKLPRWRPFVAPYSISGGVNLTPRLVSYFEIAIARKNPYDRQDPTCINGCVAIGLAEKSPGYGRSNLPGWDGCSYGYHSDNGGLYHCSGHLLRQSASFGPGDVIGMGLDYVARGIFVTKNGKFLGFASYKLTVDYLSKTDFYPVVGMDSEEMSVAVNFGNVEQKFRFDLAAYCKRQQQLVSTKERIAKRYQFSKVASRNRTFKSVR